MKKQLIIGYWFLVIYLFLPVCIYGTSQALAEELIYNTGTKKAAAKKVYLYENGKLIEIKTLDDSGDLNISYKYFYLEGKLASVQEFTNEVRIKYAVFFYNEKGTIQSKIDYNSDKNPTCLFEFNLGEDNTIREIKEYLPDKTYLGARRFIYEKGLLTAEEHVDKSGEVMLRKEYKYQGTQIVRVDFYLKNRKIREIERSYAPFEGPVSQLGLPADFYDIR